MMGNIISQMDYYLYRVWPELQISSIVPTTCFSSQLTQSLALQGRQLQGNLLQLTDPSVSQKIWYLEILLDLNLSHNSNLDLMPVSVGTDPFSATRAFLSCT